MYSFVLKSLKMVIYIGNKQDGTNMFMNLNYTICICWSVVFDLTHRTVCCESCCTVLLEEGEERHRLSCNHT